MHVTSRTFALAALAAASLAAGCAKSRGQQDDRGLRLTIEAARLTAERRVEVTYRVTSATGFERTRAGMTNRWTLATLGADPGGVRDALAYRALILNGGQPVRVNGVEQQQPGSETEDEGTPVETMGDGRFRYTFTTPVPEDVPPTQTLRVGVFSQVQTNPGQQPAELEEDRPNAVFDFVPAGGAPQTREVVSEAACNTCHGEVRAHGGGRRGVAICTTCHTPQLFDPDTIDLAMLDPTVVGNVTLAGAPAPANPLDLGRMVHRIHQGRNLATVQGVLAAARAAPPADQAAVLASPFGRYTVVGFRGGVNTYGEARVRTENGVATVGAAGVAFPAPNDVRNCAQCHASDARDAGVHLREVSRRSCTGCHVDLWLRPSQPTPEYHVPHPPLGSGPGSGADALLASDSACRACHSQEFAQGDTREFYRFVGNAHVVPVKSSRLPGLSAEIVDLVVDPATRRPTLIFRLRNGDGTQVTDLAQFASTAGGSLRATVVGPTRPDYQYFPNYFQENLQVGSTFDAATGLWTHPFVAAVPEGATGTWSAAIEVRRRVNLDNPNLGPTTTIAVTEAAPNPIRHFDVATGAERPDGGREMAVTQALCNSCHLELEFHGAQRKNVEYCVMCHAADLTDWGRRPKTGTASAAVVNVAATPDSKEERSVHFMPMIHRIHTGNGLELSKPYVAYGFGGPAFFDESGIPAEGRARCLACHPDDRYKLERMPRDRPATVANETATPLHAPGSADPNVPGAQTTLAMTSACVSCHDGYMPERGPQSGRPQTVREHAQEFTSGARERCIECHGDGRALPVAQSHAVPGR